MIQHVTIASNNLHAAYKRPSTSTRISSKQPTSPLPSDAFELLGPLPLNGIRAGDGKVDLFPPEWRTLAALAPSKFQPLYYYLGRAGVPGVSLR